MIHHSCDRCQKMIDTEDEMRYVIKIEIRAAMDSVTVAEHDDRDHLLELEEIMDRVECNEDAEFSEELYQTQQHDLCSTCYRSYMKNPLKREAENRIW